MNFFAYLKFIPLLVQLIGFIRQAQTEFTGADSGPQKMQWVVSQLVGLVSSFAGAGVISQKLADTITAKAEAIIEVIVQLFKAVHGAVPQLPATQAPAPAPVG
jgi:hypothetical protein